MQEQLLLSKQKNIKGTHLDTTTLISLVDILGLVEKTKNYQPTFELIMTLSQFIEAIVIQDSLYFGESYRSSWNPYGELIEESKIVKRIGKKILKRHQVSFDSVDLELDAIRWATTQIKKMPLHTLRLTVNARSSCYRAIKETKGIEDNKNPVQEMYFSLPQKEGDDQLVDAVKESSHILEFNQISGLGFHVLVRIYLLVKAISYFDGLSYYPHFTRVPLIQSTLIEKSNDNCFRKWSINQIRQRRTELIKKYCTPDEYADLAFELSPIFLACLINAKNPLEILDNALKLRSNIYAKQFRKSCRKYEKEIKKGITPIVEFRSELINSISDLDAVIKSNISESSKFTGSISFLGPKAEYSIERSISDESKNPITIFLSNIMRSTLSIVSAEELLSNIFGKLPRIDSWLLETYKEK